MKLACLNIERDNHYTRWLPFMKDWQPDVLCLQELPEDDLPRLAAELGFPHTAYAPLTRHMGKPATPRPIIIGQGILSRTPLENIHILPYYGQGSGRDNFDDSTSEAKIATSQYTLLVANIQGHRIATTHFPWTPNGESDAHQHAALKSMLTHLQTLGDFTLCGDFNAPRGKDIFTELAKHYTDNIPPHHICSLDKSLHRVGENLNDYMVDGLFTTPTYKAENVQLHKGLSDHMAITATLSKS